ncbi:pentapeptide repeat-containing protein [Chlorobaculum sp. 24CR]|uniref:pentapeptide repeat-containing protein n=1 Tax=Chlorobaculum sp. 24CR TaxID=2508878 RepID=UPI001FD69A9A|nr:pentapeptide repeat-containing protein [Chlorobaculum sp. 24CR]
MIYPLFRYCGVAACAGFLLFGSAHPLIAADARQEAVARKGSFEWNELRTQEPALRADLSGAKLKGRRLRTVNFKGANLVGADLSQCDMGRSDFRDADLHGADISGSVVFGSRFNGANLAGASLASTSCTDADFTGAKMASTVLRKSELGKASMREADLRGADLRETNLEYADLSHADLRAANLWLSSTGGANFSGAVISNETVLPNGKEGSARWAEAHGARFMPVVAQPATASSRGPATARAGRRGEAALPSPDSQPKLAATLNPLRAWRPAPSTIAYDADQFELLKSNVTKWNKIRKQEPEMAVNLKEAPLANRVLAYADLHAADLEKASFKRADLDQADLRNANLRGADLRSANLQRADFRQADLRGANLWLANTSWARYEGAIISSETVLDSGKKATPAWARKHAARFSNEPGR